MQFQDNQYLDLTTYPEIYRELVYQRNSAIRWLEEHALLSRKRVVDEKDRSEWQRHQSAATYRPIFRDIVLQLLDRLYSHDAVEAMYDFNSAELGEWSDTEANRLERELQRLQLVIGKLEARYRLQYKLIFEYADDQHTLYLNSVEVFSCGPQTLRHRLLVALFSEPMRSWENQAIEDYFIEHFNYHEGELSDKNIEKAANDIRKDVAAKVAAKDFLFVSNASVQINPSYLP